MDHPEKPLEFFHRQMNEELNVLENAARSLAQFPDVPSGHCACRWRVSAATKRGTRSRTGACSSAAAATSASIRS